MSESNAGLFNNCLFSSIFVGVLSFALYHHFEDAGELETTFAMIKPDALQRKDDILDIITQNGFVVVQTKQVQLTTEEASVFYEEHADRSFYENLVEFMISGPVLVMQLQRVDAVTQWRLLMGPTDSEQAKQTDSDSIRALFGTDVQRNAVHGSDSRASAAREIAFFFN